jgi:calcineurin-like phosphoesterase family protein
MTWFISDAHLYHENIIKLAKRPFSSVEEMNEQIIENINKKVGEKDVLYNLGDFAFRYQTEEHVNYALRRINCKNHILVRGNHDNYLEKPEFNRMAFMMIKDYLVLEYKKVPIILSHYPIYEWELMRRNSIHLFGHVHDAFSRIPRGDEFEKRTYNVGVEKNDYFPVSIDQIMDLTR